MKLRTGMINLVRSIFVVFLALLSAYGGGLCYGQAVAVNPSYFPLTQNEQAGRLSGLFSRSPFGSQIGTQPTDRIGTKRYFQRDYRSEWRKASLSEDLSEKIRIAEKIGNQGGGRWAAERGYIKLLGSQDRGIVQGPDSIYYDPYHDTYLAIERKGGTSQPKFTYGARQGTNLNEIRSAETTLKSLKTSPAEKEAAARLIKAAQKKKLQTVVVRTEHVQGTPGDPAQTGNLDSSNIRREARITEDRLTSRHPDLAKYFQDAETKNRAATIRYRASIIGEEGGIMKGVRIGGGVLGLAGSVLIGIDAYNESVNTWEMFYDPAYNGSIIPYMNGVLSGSKWAEAGTFGLGSMAIIGSGAESLGWLGEAGGFRLFAQFAGKWFLPVAVGTEVLSFGKDYYQFRMGRLSPLEWSHRKTEAEILWGFALTGGAVGAAVGAPEGGVGAIPGAIIGGGIGMITGGAIQGAIQIYAKIHWYFVGKEFSEEQQRAVNEALDRRYGLR